ncbi:MAG: hypothetical protein ABIP55_14780 [Tepidisphaeraceae bacterium]
MPPALRPVIDYRQPTVSTGSARIRFRYVREAFVFFGLMGCAVGLLGRFTGNVATYPDGQRVLGAFMLLICAMGYVVFRVLDAPRRTSDCITMYLSAAAAVFGAAVACAFRFPRRPLQDLETLVVGVSALFAGLGVFAATRSAIRRRERQSFEK